MYTIKSYGAITRFRPHSHWGFSIAKANLTPPYPSNLGTRASLKLPLPERHQQSILPYPPCGVVLFLGDGHSAGRLVSCD
jgi:hypothetical protein